MIIKLVAFIIYVVLTPHILQANDSKATISPDNALKLLLEGNNRFISNTNIHKNLAEETMNLKEGQDPFAVVISCSDSRVPPEIIFDQGPGDLFIIRNAGNVIGPVAMDSAKFAILKLHTPLVVVMGHQNCGAVKATLFGQENVPELKNIFPLIERAIKTCKDKSDDVVKNAIQCNAVQGVRDLTEDPQIKDLIQQKKLRVVAAYFSFKDGKVILLE